MANHHTQPASVGQPLPPPIPPPMPPPWYCFNPSDRRVILTFLIPKIQNRHLPLHSIVDGNVFQDDPTELARANGYGEEKPVIFFFTEKNRKTALWKRNSHPYKVISNATSVVGEKKRLSFAGNPTSSTKWYLDEYTTELEVSDLAVYKLFTGRKPAHGLLLLEAAQDLNPAVPLQTNASSSVLPPSNPPPPVHQQQYHGNSSAALPEYIPQHLNPAFSGNPHLQHGSHPNPQLQHGSSSLNFIEETHQPGLSSLHFPEVNPNPQLQPGSSSLPLPEENPQLLQDLGHTDSSQHLNGNIDGEPQNWEDWYRCLYEEDPLNTQPTTANTGLEVQQPTSPNPLQPTENMDIEGGY